MEGKEEVLANCQIAIETVKDTSKLDAELIGMTEEIAGLELKAKVMTAEYAAGKIGSKEYSARYDKLVERHDTLKLEKMAKANETEDKQYRARELADFIQSLTSVTILPEFDEKVWLALVDQAQVQENGDIVFLLKNGERIR